MSTAEQILAEAKEIPPFPKVANQVMKMLEDPNVKAKDLAEVIQYDSVITANVLKTCNAAYFGLKRKVSSLGDALVIVGHDILKDIMVTSCSAQFYKGQAGEGYDLAEGELWEHSVATAIMAKQLAGSFIKSVDEGKAFTVGLLHDIGKSFISKYVAEEFDKIMEMAHGGDIAFIEAEKQVLGIDHAELGAHIMTSWAFPEDMVEAIRLHHASDALEQGDLTAILALSNTLVISMGIGVGADGLSGKVKGEALNRFGISPIELDRLMSSLVFEIEKAEEMLSLSN